MRATYNPRNWYWIVANSQVYSSAAGNYVPATDSTYQSWLTTHSPTNIDTEANLGAVLAPYGLRPTPPGILAGYQTAAANGVDSVILRILFNHENRIRSLAG